MINHSSVAYAYLHCIKKLINWCYAEVSAGYTGGSAGKNTRQSHENPTPLSNTNPTAGKNTRQSHENPTPLSNANPTAGKNTRQSHENPTPLSNKAGAVAKTDESFGGESKFSIDFFFPYKIITVS